MINFRVVCNVVAAVAAISVAGPSLALQNSLGSTDLKNCGVGYIKAMKVLSTRNSSNPDPISIYVTLDTNGWPDPAFTNDKYYHDPQGRNWITITAVESDKRWDLARSSLQSAMLSRLPVAVYTRTDKCRGSDEDFEITSCADEGVCLTTG
ncbi:hypothetical protein FHR21_004001 [Sphingopyxis panaciterrulae]|uniref:Uncharacterized protein n=1 Tax=Sphingopyxis panaciterrulae TaxID=462372 RepID=A0A7W9B9A0_9SPHN|nr:hypothetical protein [Sphingopyxis panaciterrulae]